MPTIHIANWPQPVDAGRHRILEAALDAGVPFPHSCGSGECGSCKCQLIEGEVTFDRYSPDALSEDERERGLILACRTRPVGDVRVRWLSKASVPAMVKVDARVESVDRVARDVIVLTLALPQGKAFDFRPGQFAKLRMGRLPARSYSMANQPGQGRLVFHVRVVPGGKVSGHVSGTLKAGDAVEVRGPFGEACWAGAQTAPLPRQLLLLAGGTGMAPILSVLDAALADGQLGHAIHVYHGVRTEADLYATDLLEQRVRRHGIRFVPVLVEPSAGRRSGHLHEAVGEDFRALAGTSVYVAGPPADGGRGSRHGAGAGCRPRLPVRRRVPCGRAGKAWPVGAHHRLGRAGHGARGARLTSGPGACRPAPISAARGRRRSGWSARRSGSRCASVALKST